MKLSRLYTEQLDMAFSVLKENPSSNIALEKISSILKDMTDLEYNIYVVNTKINNNDVIWVMSVYPEISTIDKIINNFNKMNLNTIQDLWKKNKKWTIEIDSRIFSKGLSFTDRELTAMLLHEIGHIIFSNSITSRINNILSYELAKNSNFYYGMEKTNIFRRMLSLPILGLCTSSQSKEKSLKNEINADKFSISCGYRRDLESAIGKIIKFSNSTYGSTSASKNTDITLKFASDSIDQFKQRKDKLLKKNLLMFKENSESPVLEHTIDTIISDIFYSEGSDENDTRKIEYFHKKIEEAEAEYTLEAFTNKYPPIDPSTFDYIDIKTTSMKSINDKMMLAVYVQSKIDLLNRYQKMYDTNSPKVKKLPYDYDDILALKEKLMQQKENIINGRIQGRDNGILVAWPEGYDG